MSKFQTMFSMSLEYMGTAIVSNILQGNSTYRRSLYDRLVGFNTSIHAEDLVLALSTETELEVPMKKIWYDIRNHDQVSISSTFSELLWDTKMLLAQIFSTYSLALQFVWQKEIDAKAPCKMLVKLTTGVNFTCSFLSLKCFAQFLCAFNPFKRKSCKNRS
jgi:hypothetical protein